MKHWLLQRFLPMWAKNTVLRDLERAEAHAADLERENREIRAYIKGLKYGARRMGRQGKRNGGREAED